MNWLIVTAASNAQVHGYRAQLKSHSFAVSGAGITHRLEQAEGALDFVSFAQEQTSQVGPILPGDACYQRFFHS
jgi:hypothetical protein